MIISLNSLLHDFKRTKYNLELKKSFIILPTIALDRQGKRVFAVEVFEFLLLCTVM